jgi:lipopolysaccharide biosynthesis regulator YciM
MTTTLDFIWLLFLLPLVFGLGWFFSRLDIKHWRLESRHRPRAYFKGLNHLLTGQQDRAIDSFIEAVQNDPDTSELHFTLGNLFRRRGEYDRAVRVHEHLLARADISDSDRERAQFALAQDFAKAGLLDRAEAALANVHTVEGQQTGWVQAVSQKNCNCWARAITPSSEHIIFANKKSLKKLLRYRPILRVLI